MKIVDANVLLYAVNESAEQHENARSWLDRALSGSERVGFAWLVLLAFVRISTSRAIFDEPLTVPAALSRVDAWLGAPSAVVVNPTARHRDELARMLAGRPGGGNVVNDAHLAALAAEHKATIVTYDADFGRFTDVSSIRPD